MRRALLVSPSARPGGAERALAALARHLPESGWQPTVVLLEDGPFTGWLEEAGVPATVVATGRTRRLDRTAVALRALRRLGQRVGAELVLSNQTKGHVYGGVTARLLGVPAAFWQHGVPESTALDRVAARVPAGAIVVSTAEALDAQRRLAPRARLRLIQPGVEIDDVARRRGEGAALRRRFGLRGPTVGIVGRLQPWKGQDVFLRAAAAVARVHPDVTFAVVGGAVLGWEGDYPATLQRFAGTTPELAGRVHFAGHQDDVYPWYDALDVVVHASRASRSGWCWWRRWPSAARWWPRPTAAPSTSSRTVGRGCRPPR